ncbi:hypothetical protein GCM10025859_52200 [Alicyclobacillus fastidiosus]|nr:hypothetical protein GCM10025859_52200 [Alicyclobacillus fastidiosus]
MVAPVEQALGMRCTKQQMEDMSKHPLVKNCIDVTEKIAELHRTLPEDFKAEGTYFVPFRTS